MNSLWDKLPKELQQDILDRDDADKVMLLARRTRLHSVLKKVLKNIILIPGERSLSVKVTTDDKSYTYITNTFVVKKLVLLGTWLGENDQGEEEILGCVRSGVQWQ